MDKLRIVFFGTPDFVLPVLNVLHEHHTIVGVVTTPDTVQGRKKVLTPTPVKEYALNNIPDAQIFTPERLSREVTEQIKNLEPELFIVAAYGKIIPQELLDIPTFGSINVHPSLLPIYRGPSPIQTALLNGDDISGVTLLLMDSEVDHGPILAQEEITINPNDTFASLHVTMFEKAAEMLIPTIQGFINKTLIPREQDHEKAVFCEHITKESGYFDLQSPPSPDVLDRMIRAYYPWPTAWTRFRTNKGEEKILKLLPEGKVQPEGKNPMPLKDFLNGHPEMNNVMKKLLGE